MTLLETLSQHVAPSEAEVVRGWLLYEYSCEQAADKLKIDHDRFHEQFDPIIRDLRKADELFLWNLPVAIAPIKDSSRYVLVDTERQKPLPGTFKTLAKAQEALLLTVGQQRPKGDKKQFEELVKAKALELSAVLASASGASEAEAAVIPECLEQAATLMLQTARDVIKQMSRNSKNVYLENLMIIQLAELIGFCQRHANWHYEKRMQLLDAVELPGG